LRNQRVPLELSKGPGEEHSPIGEDWGCGREEVEFEEGSMR